MLTNLNNKFKRKSTNKNNVNGNTKDIHKLNNFNLCKNPIKNICLVRDGKSLRLIRGQQERGNVSDS